jgi:ribosomal protein S18 acetylase RimI-like enzyme/N-acetylglutamate synthase-like GNAT family acetyltransferase
VGLSAAITRRPARREDAVAVAAFVVADETVLLGRPSRLGEVDILDWWSRTDLERDSWLFEEKGRPVAVGWFESRDELGVFVGIVAQGAKGRGLGAALVGLGESCAHSAGVARVQAWTLAADGAAAELFVGRGYREVRRFYDMAIELAEPPAAPILPDGLTLEVFRTGDARAFHEALGEAFQDHWEHHPVPFEEWWEEKQRAPGFDPTLWFVVRDGDELAATIRNDPGRNGGGYVGALGVRRRWRGRGLGRALLLQTFGEFQRRGVARVTLGVDADSPTGATALYESVGMAVESEAIVFEKESR